MNGLEQIFLMDELLNGIATTKESIKARADYAEKMKEKKHLWNLLLTFG
jgi:hypothetical protein